MNVRDRGGVELLRRIGIGIARRLPSRVKNQRPIFAELARLLCAGHPSPRGVEHLLWEF
jgi:hypothetical protein